MAQRDSPFGEIAITAHKVRGGKEKLQTNELFTATRKLSRSRNSKTISSTLESTRGFVLHRKKVKRGI